MDGLIGWFSRTSVKDWPMPHRPMPPPAGGAVGELTHRRWTLRILGCDDPLGLSCRTHAAALAARSGAAIACGWNVDRLFLGVPWRLLVVLDTRRRYEPSHLLGSHSGRWASEGPGDHTSTTARAGDGGMDGNAAAKVDVALYCVGRLRRCQRRLRTLGSFRTRVDRETLRAPSCSRGPRMGWDSRNAPAAHSIGGSRPPCHKAPESPPSRHVYRLRVRSASNAGAVS